MSCKLPLQNCILFALIAVIMCSCHTTRATHQTSVQQTESTLADSIQHNEDIANKRQRYASKKIRDQLLPSLSRYVNPKRKMEERFDVTANNISAKEFFMGLIENTKYNMIVSPSLAGTISLNLKNVTIRQAMDAAKDMYGYQYRKTSYGYEVSSPKLRTKLFHINYLDVKRKGKSYTQLTTGQVSNKVGTTSVGASSNNSLYPQQSGSTSAGLGTISSIETQSEMKFWEDISKTLTKMVGDKDGRSVIINSQTGVVAVHAFPGELNEIARFINNIQSSLNRQVILEAKILEVQLNANYQAGVDWSILGNPALTDANGVPLDSNAGIGQDGNKTFAGTTPSLTDFTGIFAARIKGNIKLLIDLLQTQGNVQVLASPHISTVNNQKAVIKVGEDEFFVTGVSTSNTIIGTNTIPSQDVALTPFFSGITLDVTPEISWDNTVVLHIHPSVSKVTEQTKVIGLGSTSSGTANNLSLPLAFSTIRESDSIVRASNGQVVVIGGLMQNNTAETIAETPWLGKIPFLGAAFRRTKQESKKSELIILLRPVVASNKEITKNLKRQQREFKILRRPFHAGSLPKVFGNEGERSDS